MRKIHRFDNGILVYDDHLLPVQRDRYAVCNVHEQDEETLFLAIIAELSPRALYMNVGTAIGYYALLAKRRRPDLSVHCVEALPRHIRYFRENIALNKFVNADFPLHEVAVSTSKGKAKFVDKAFGSSLARISQTPVKRPSLRRQVVSVVRQCFGLNVPGELSVRAVSLADLVTEIPDRYIDLLQMDIQGFELPVLKAFFATAHGKNGAIGRFLVGTHGDAIHAGCRSLFLDNGYEILHDEPLTQNQPDGILCAKLRSLGSSQ